MMLGKQTLVSSSIEPTVEVAPKKKKKKKNNQNENKNQRRRNQKATDHRQFAILVAHLD
jgi:hypothetical protein